MKKGRLLLATVIGSCIMAGSVFAGDWKLSSGRWWYQNDDGSYPANGWQWINGQCYCFDQNGYCLLNTITPDGYMVDASGAWIVNGIVQTQTADQEIRSEASGSMDIFAESAGNYWFSSGAGAWATELTLYPDGSFEGSYHDSDMGSSGAGYVATVYVSTFHGRFIHPVEINSYTYKMELEGDVVIDNGSGQYIDDQVCYVYTEPYGMEVGHEFYLYKPGAPVSELPEAFVGWVRMMMGSSSSSSLPFYGIYNAEGQYGFAGEN